jgi:glycosyltransferase involved in cell wall biosynthesis
MYERLVKKFLKINVEYEIIFVKDCSPYNLEEVLKRFLKRMNML